MENSQVVIEPSKEDELNRKSQNFALMAVVIVGLLLLLATPFGHIILFLGFVFFVFRVLSLLWLAVGQAFGKK